MRPNVGINGMPKAVPLNDGLGVTVAEGRKRRNAHKRLLDLELGCLGLDGRAERLSLAKSRPRCLRKTPQPLGDPD